MKRVFIAAVLCLVVGLCGCTLAGFRLKLAGYGVKVSLEFNGSQQQPDGSQDRSTGIDVSLLEPKGEKPNGVTPNEYDAVGGSIGRLTVVDGPGE